MTAPPAGPIADFCAELRRLVRVCQVPQTDIAAALGLSESTVSGLLGGQRRTAPDWDVVRRIVSLCARSHGPGSPPGMHLDEWVWKARHAELERTVETALFSAIHRSREPRPVPVPPTARPVAGDWAAVALPEAMRLLAESRPELTPRMEALLESPTAASDSLPVLDDLLQDFPQRVRATHGTDRAALLQAARVVLIAKAVLRHGATHEEALDLIQDLTQDAHYAHLYAWASDGGGDASPSLYGFRYTVTGETARRLNRYYQDAAAPLAASCPEFALAAGLPCAALSERLGDPPRTGLAGLGALLAEFAGQGTCATAGRALLRAPIASLDSPGPRLPLLADAYISPRFRLVGSDVVLGEAIASDKWWEQRPSYDGFERFLAAHLLSLPALLAPLLVLGHPGAGKSLFTKLLTARLPAREFRHLRVELRHTPAEADVQTQLEHALRLATGRQVSWPDWSEEQPGVTPVVLLDGFDELLQAGAQRLDSARQWSYLRDVQRFQQREAELGRPLVVIVTSRTVVADRTDVPEGSQVLRLEPFGASEIDRWLTIWNTTNAAYLEQRGLRPLSPADLRPHRDLASQPLLLLMLALYDAVDNALQRLGDDESISRTQLYDRLLTEFVRRQVDKDGSLPPHEQAAAIDREFHHLSVIALGMFHRGAQAISGEEADRDLRALADPAAHGEQAGSGLVFGRFFFVHEAQAVVTEQRLRSYEFMHATFGEHLAARLIDQALRRLADRGEGDGTADLGDGELYALLSFTPLTDRAQLVENLWSMLAAWPEDRARHRLQDLLVSLFRAAEWHSGQRGGPDHAPVRVTRAYRDAVYEVNLLLIAVVAAGEVHASEFLGAEGLGDAWRRRTMMWRSQLSEESWKLLSSTLDPDRCWRPSPDDDAELRPDMRLSTTPTLSLDHHLGWMLGTVDDPDAHDIGPAVITSNDAAAEVFTQLTFLGDRHAELLLHAVYPLLRRMPHTLLMYRTDHAGRPRSAAQSLVALLMGQARDLTATALPDLYAQCVNAVAMLPSGEADTYLEAVCRRLAADIPLLSDEDLLGVLRELSECVAELGTGLTGGLREALLDCVYAAVGRVDRDLTLMLADLQREVERRDAHGEESSPLRALLHLAQTGRSSSTWRWASLVGVAGLDGEFDDLLDDLDLSAYATRHPAAVIALLRVAAELDLTDWLATRAPELLAALPAPAFGLLLPSDLRYLRPALRPDAYEAEFAEVESIWGRTGG
ncbi:hypothetical protein SLINC_6614 [Streptomyces lincolnensis]|uniref:Uncharacterized protein n=1 Tax=Streptomyces lincolnensis TaxID=1915 RepID=A0A1B1MJR5_STRLN|nr:hypothetical protein [Streptomyces lincolnensis]ANS68838.1 hypothetical protein SLINC_6614 [Streptomyces lincolnensis]AXG52956.1 hypothetical protein SLCG_1801 [Streptomyces lincolnensis]QMV10438.1 hypothetical protein GJU35_35440 [Streptomyces lincolnensis]